jgi:hypothetical protein
MRHVHFQEVDNAEHPLEAYSLATMMEHGLQVVDCCIRLVLQPLVASLLQIHWAIICTWCSTTCIQIDSLQATLTWDASEADVRHSSRRLAPSSCMQVVAQLQTGPLECLP